MWLSFSRKDRISINLFPIPNMKRSAPAAQAIPASNFQQDLDDLARYDFILPRIKFACTGGVNDYWHAKPGGDAHLLRELSQVIRCKTKPILNTDDFTPHTAHEGQLNAVLTLDEPERMAHFPFLFMTGESHYRITAGQEQNLKAYLENGGFINGIYDYDSV